MPTCIPAREYLMIVKESALGTPMASPVDGTDKIYIRLNDGNAFSMTAAPVIQEVMYGGGLAVQAEAVSDHYGCSGTLKTLVYPTQAPMLMGWGLTLINTAQTSPWVTTEPCRDLASCSLYHAIRRSDMTYRLKRYSGAKVKSLKLDVSRGSTVGTLSLELQACRAHGYAADTTTDPDEIEFPAPNETDYPFDPYTFSHTSGKMIFGTVRSDYEDLSVSVTNVLDGRWFEHFFLSVNQFCGRASTLDTSLYYKATPDDHADLETIASKPASITFDNGTNTFKIEFRGRNYIQALPFDLPLNMVYLKKMTMKNMWDPAALAGAGEDISFSFT